MPTVAAFFRVEGVLVQRSASGCAAWMAARQRDAWGRLGRLGAVAASAMLDRTGEIGLATELGWRSLEGCSEDRFQVLAEDYLRDRILPSQRDAGLDLLGRCRAAGDRIVLLSDHPHAVMAPFAERLGADDLICNHLEVADHRLTGALVPPVVTGRVDGGWVRAYAAKHGLHANQCRAYGASTADATLLSGVGHPCAVAPGRGLRRLAAQFDWPIVEA